MTTATLQVTTAGLDFLTLSPATSSVAAGVPQAFSDKGVDRFGNIVGDATSATTLTITPNGAGTGASCNNITHTCVATRAGTYAITGTDGTATGTATLTVTPAALDHLTLSPAAATVTAGSGQAYTASGFDAYGNSLGNVTAAASLTITPNAAGTGATCNNTTHTCTATKAGSYSVTGACAGKTAKSTLNVLPRFTLRPGLGTAISAGRNGSVWILGTTPAGGGNYAVYRWNGTGWTHVPGGAVRIAVDPSGNPWIINSAHAIYHWNGKGWVHYPGAATDISVGANGSLWILGTNQVGGGYGSYQWTGSGWATVAGGAVRIAVDAGGNPWILNSAHHIYHWNGKGWASYLGAATDIAVGANGSIWIVGTGPVSGGYSVYYWNGGGWTSVPKGAIRVTVAPAGNPWIVNSGHQIFSS
jgi:hypothetical protein